MLPSTTGSPSVAALISSTVTPGAAADFCGCEMENLISPFSSRKRYPARQAMNLGQRLYPIFGSFDPCFRIISTSFADIS